MTTQLTASMPNYKMYLKRKETSFKHKRFVYNSHAYKVISYFTNPNVKWHTFDNSFAIE